MPRELTPLTYDEADEIVHRLVGNDALSADLGARLLASIPLAGPPASGEDVTGVERAAAAIADLWDADDWPRICKRSHSNPECPSADDYRSAARAALAASRLPAAPSEGKNISAIMSELEDVMDACCDQPLSVDRMTLTRSWRAILESAFAAPPSGRVPEISEQVLADVRSALRTRVGTSDLAPVFADHVPSILAAVEYVAARHRQERLAISTDDCCRRDQNHLSSR